MAKMIVDDLQDALHVLRTAAHQAMVDCDDVCLDIVPSDGGDMLALMIPYDNPGFRQRLRAELTRMFGHRVTDVQVTIDPDTDHVEIQCNVVTAAAAAADLTATLAAANPAPATTKGDSATTKAASAAPKAAAAAPRAHRGFYTTGVPSDGTDALDPSPAPGTPTRRLSSLGATTAYQTTVIPAGRH